MSDCKNTSPAAKQALRRAALAARRSLSPEQRAEYSARAVRRLLAAPEFLEARTVLLYRALADEVSLEGLPAAPEAAGKRLLYPRCTGPGTMEAYLPAPGAAWRRGAFGIWEPDPERALLVAPEEIDLVVCPCAAFREDGARLGMGGGYYDRFLPRCSRARVACIAFEAQKAAAIPKEPWDVPMEVLFTEQAVYRPRR